MFFFSYLCPSGQELKDLYPPTPLAEQQLCACCDEYYHTHPPWRPSEYETIFQSPLSRRPPTVIYHQETYVIEAPSTLVNDSTFREQASYRSLPRQATSTQRREPYTVRGTSTNIQLSNPPSKSSANSHTQTLIEANYTMPGNTALYTVLEVKPSATPSEIKTSYRKLALKFHPDKSDAPGAADKFKALSHAYAILSDERLKMLYDRWGLDAAEHPDEYDEAGEPTDGFEYDQNLRGAQVRKAAGAGGGYKPDGTRRGGPTEWEASGGADAPSYYTGNAGARTGQSNNAHENSRDARPQPTQNSRLRASFTSKLAPPQSARTPWTDRFGDPFPRLGAMPEVFNLLDGRSANTFRQEAGLPARNFSSQARPCPPHRGEPVYGPGSPGSPEYNIFHGMGSVPGGYRTAHGMGSRPGGGMGGRGGFGDNFFGGGFMGGFMDGFGRPRY